MKDIEKREEKITKMREEREKNVMLKVNESQINHMKKHININRMNLSDEYKNQILMDRIEKKTNKIENFK
jgi:hypothetical protein